MTMRRTFAIAAAVVLAAPCCAALAEESGAYTFTVLYDGDPVGKHRFVYAHDGDRIEIQEATEIEVTFAAIPLYTFEHQARQLWENGRAVRIDATTDANGDKLAITVEGTEDGYIRTVNGRVVTFEDPTSVLALWNPDTLEHDAFFSAIEDKTFDLSFEYRGTDKITLAGRQIEAEHYRMTGDAERDLWFGPNGHVVKVAFERYGSDIEYVRDQITAEAPTSACTALC